ncbi:MAG: YgjV family protein [Clostridia bacterium]|nr:YgjV family protein [Clostridia bacterium]
MTTMQIIGNIIGFVAVALLIISYQFNSKNKVIFFYATSTTLYIFQYFFLGAFEGVYTEIFAVLISIVAGYQTKEFIKKHKKLIIFMLYVLFFVGGLIVIFTTKEITLINVAFGIVPIIANTAQTSAFWMKNEKIMRIVSLAGAPLWLIYNVFTLSIFPAVGNIFMICSIIISIIRYDVKKESKKIDE